MNDMSKPALKPTSKIDTAALKAAEAQPYALALAREHMEDWQQVRMLTRALRSVLKDEIKRANDKEGVIETYDAESFMDGVEWLHQVMAERAETLRKHLQKAGVITED